MSKSRFILWAIALAVIYIVLVLIVPRQTLITMFAGIFLGILSAVFFVCWPVVKSAIFDAGVDRVSQLSFGILLVFSSMGLNRVWWLFYHFSGQPEKLRNHPVLAFIYYLSIIGAALVVSALGYPAEEKPRHAALFVNSNRRLIIVFGAIGGIASLLLSFFFGFTV